MPSNALRLAVAVFISVILSLSPFGVTPRALAQDAPAPAASDDESIPAATDVLNRAKRGKRENRETEGREKPKTCKQAQQIAQDACSGANAMAGLGPMGQQMMSQAQQQQQQQQPQPAPGSQQSGQQQQSGQAQACKTAAMIGGLTSLISSLMAMGCTAASGDCDEICKDDPNAYCGGGPQAGAQLLAAALGALGAAMQAKQCKQNFAQATPTPGMDCSNPTFAAQSIQCICQADPKNRMCTGIEQFPGGLVSTNGDMGPVGPGAPDDGLGNLGDPNGFGVDPGKPAGAMGSATADGGGGGGPQAARGAGFKDSGGGGGYEEPQKASVIQGVSGGAGGGGGGSGPGPGGRDGNGGGREGQGNLDLSKYLPKAKTQNLGGMSISSKDGITGPMGPTLFEKVSNQYQQQKPNMIQDK
jgi:hypothetical protein